VLVALQRALEQEERRRLLLTTLRGERAFLHKEFTAMEAGGMAQWTAYGTGDMPVPPVAAAYYYLGTGLVKRAHAEVLKYLTQVVEIAKLPPEQQDTQLTLLAAAFPVPPTVPSRSFQAGGLMFATFRRQEARLRCLILTVATERYRLAH